MRFFTTKIVLIIILLNALYSPVNAQFGSPFNNMERMAMNYQRAKDKGKNVKSYLSYSLGGGMPFSSGKYVHSYQTQAVDGTLLGERSIVREVKATGWYATASTYFTLTSLTESSTLAFSIAAVGYVLDYDIGEVRLSSYNMYNYNLFSMQIGIPLCLVYKYGGEAVFDKSQKMSFGFGMGLAPMVYSNAFGGDVILNTGIRPFLQAEVGFFAGIEWKITGSCLAGPGKVLNLSSERISTYHPTLPNNSLISMTSKPVFSVGIAIMPFSYDWESFGW